MKTKKFNFKKRYVQDEKRAENNRVRLIYIFGIITVAYYYFIEPKTIGHDNRYLFFIFILPTLFGAAILGIYRRQFLINRFSTNKGFFLWTFMIFFYLLQGIIFSYISFGQVAKMSWDYINYQQTQKNQTEILTCPITNIWSGRRPVINFIFNGRHESLNVKNSSIKNYTDKNTQDFLLIINATKGVWNYYIVHTWRIEKK